MISGLLGRVDKISFQRSNENKKEVERMSEVETKKDKLPNKPARTNNKKEDANDLNKKLDHLISLYEGLHDDLQLCIKVNQIVIELLGGISPGRKNLDSVEIARLRMQGVKVKDLARMQNISEAAMSRKLRELKEVGLLNGATEV